MPQKLFSRNFTLLVMAYGFLFDGFRSAVYLVLIPTGAVVCLIGLMSTGFFRALDIP